MHLKNVSLSFFRQTLFFLELNQQKFKIVAAKNAILLLSWKRIFSKCRELEGKCKFCIGLPSITDLRSLKFTILNNFCLVYFPVKTFWVERWGFPHLTIWWERDFHWHHNSKVDVISKCKFFGCYRVHWTCYGLTNRKILWMCLNEKRILWQG